MKYPTVIGAIHPAKGWAATEKTCETCGEVFLGWNCHRHCQDCPRSKRRRKPPENRTCPSCTKPFVLGLDGNRGRGGRKFCDDCRKGGRKGLKAPPRRCKQCDKPFQPGWTRGDAELCSRKCQGYWINANGLGPKHDDEKLLKRILRAIRTTPYTMSQEMLCKVTSVSCATLNCRGWTMEFLYKEAGRSYAPPELDSRCEDRAHAALRSLFPDEEIIPQARFPGLVSEKGRMLPVDFYIRSRNLIVEIDGPHHHAPAWDESSFERTQANDQVRNRFAEENGIILLRIPSSAISSTIEKEVLQKLQDPGRGISNLEGPACLPPREPAQKKAKTNPLESPLHDVYCRGCHARPSFQQTASYLCKSCWALSRGLRRKSQKLDPGEVDDFRKELERFVADRGRYVWHPEVYLHLRPVAIGELKRHNINVTKTCRKLGFFAPEDDRKAAEKSQCVKEFVTNFHAENGRPPNVRETLKHTGIDHETLWSCMDYDAFVRSLGGRNRAHVRFRFKNEEKFLMCASQVVKKAGRPLLMTFILDQLQISYPAYLEHFRSVTSEAIHERAGIPPA